MVQVPSWCKVNGSEPCCRSSIHRTPAVSFPSISHWNWLQRIVIVKFSEIGHVRDDTSLSVQFWPVPGCPMSPLPKGAKVESKEPKLFPVGWIWCCPHPNPFPIVQILMWSLAMKLQTKRHPASTQCNLAFRIHNWYLLNLQVRDWKRCWGS